MPDDKENAVNNIPIIIGKIIMAPNALNFGIAIKTPPVISATATSGINHLICMIAANILDTFSGISFGTGM